MAVVGEWHTNCTIHKISAPGLWGQKVQYAGELNLVKEALSQDFVSAFYSPGIEHNLVAIFVFDGKIWKSGYFSIFLEKVQQFFKNYLTLLLKRSKGGLDTWKANTFFWTFWGLIHAVEWILNSRFPSKCSSVFRQQYIGVIQYIELVIIDSVVP